MTDDSIVVPDVAEPIVAYRTWFISDGGLIGTRHQTWPPRTGMWARCLVGCGRCPCTPDQAEKDHDNHGCGIYAHKDQPRPEYDEHADGDDEVFGQVLLFGQVYEYETGYRAERAEVSCLYDTGPHVADVAETYGVDLVPVPVESVEDRVARLQAKAEEQRTAPTPPLLTGGRIFSSAIAWQPITTTTVDPLWGTFTFSTGVSAKARPRPPAVAEDPTKGRRRG